MTHVSVTHIMYIKATVHPEKSKIHAVKLLAKLLTVREGKKKNWRLLRLMFAVEILALHLGT